MTSKITVNLKEYDSFKSDSLSFKKEELNTIKRLKDKIEIFGEAIEPNKWIYIIKTFQFVGYIVLQDHVLVISPKIPKISFINMIRYALGIDYDWESYSNLDKEENYYDILVLIFLQELEQIIQKGLLKGYQIIDENKTFVKGKILFKENLLTNFNRADKIFCSFDELSSDILENRIIKFVLYNLSLCYFIDEKINSRINQLFRYLDEITLQSFTKDILKSIEYTPNNLHYKNILLLCELFLESFSVEQRIGERDINSFLIDMNSLFEKFIVSILKNSLKLEIQEQKSEYADLFRQLEFKFDIVISMKEKPFVILDTKYKEYKNRPDSSDVEQLIAYSTISGIRNCGLIYPGKNIVSFYKIKQNITLYIISIDLEAQNSQEFEKKLDIFKNNFYYSIINPISKT
jgi:5-methylcytosine-specific restriction enzyme subunit McrC